MKVVINKCFGGEFGLSDKAKKKLGELGVQYDPFDIDRNNPKLIRVIEELGEEADGSFALLKVVEIPDDVQWKITARDGIEQIEEVHRVWR